ncbi:MAG: hypothetical protein H0X33_01290 [Taibaiella sp.]|nr:hypothetical protein [Taibaiella sp.]
MKNYKMYLATVVLAVSNSMYAMAQDNATTANTDAHTTTTSTNTTTATVPDSSLLSQPWVWIVGIIVLALILFAMMRGRGGNVDSRTDVSRTTVTRTDVSDTNV